jgi:hypothetical protein
MDVGEGRAERQVPADGKESPCQREDLQGQKPGPRQLLCQLHRRASKLLVKREEVGNIKPPLQRRHMLYWLAATQGKVQLINVKMDDIELRGVLEHMFEHQDLMRHLVHTVLVEAQ